DDLRHPAAANNNVLLTNRHHDLTDRDENGQVSMEAGFEGWGLSPKMAYVNNNNPAAAIGTEDDIDSQGRSFTPDSPDSMANHVQRQVLGGAPRAPPPQPVTPLHPPSPHGRQALSSTATDTSPSDIADNDDSAGRGEGGDGSAGRRGDGNSTSAGAVSLSDDASILSLSDPNLAKSSPTGDLLPRLEASGYHGGDRDPELSHSLDLDLSHSLSIYETAETASSSEAAALPALPPDPQPPSHLHL
ncbi:hypothetical protein BaRGS_00012848, partial [Batillaria attramentaria]